LILYVITEAKIGWLSSWGVTELWEGVILFWDLGFGNRDKGKMDKDLGF